MGNFEGYIMSKSILNEVRSEFFSPKLYIKFNSDHF